MNTQLSRIGVMLAAVFVLALSGPPARSSLLAAPQSGSQEDQMWDIAVEGRVTGTFQTREQGGDTLLEIELSGIRVRQLDRGLRGLVLPGPGQPIYVRVPANIPLPQGESLTARLNVDRGGRWNPAGRDWLDASSAGLPGAPDGRVESLGLSVETMSEDRIRALRVTRVSADGPAGKAGIEVGDVLVSANGLPLASPMDLKRTAAAAEGRMRLVVRDIRTGRDVPVDVSWRANMRRGDSPVELGVKTELAFLSGDPVLKITDLQRNSSAARAGLRVGWLIVKANGVPTDSESALEEAIRNGQNSIELEVFQPDSRERTTVRIELD